MPKTKQDDKKNKNIYIEKNVYQYKIQWKESFFLI